MENHDNKNSANSVAISRRISRIITALIEKRKKKCEDLSELHSLQKSCFLGDDSVCRIASKAILHLVEINILTVESILDDVATAIVTDGCNECFPNIAFLVNNLLLIDLKRSQLKNSSYKCQYNMWFPQHPLITMLFKDSRSWKSILEEVVYSYKNKDEEMISLCHLMYKPLYLYIFCDHKEDSLITLKYKMWSFIIHQIGPLDTTGILQCLLSWMQFEFRETIKLNSQFLIELCELNTTKNILDPNVLLLWQAAVLYELIINDFDPRSIIASIEDVLSCHDDLEVLNAVLLIIAKSIPLCSSTYLLELMNLSKLMVENANCGPIVRQIVKSSLLYWIANPMILTTEAVEVAKEIFALMEIKKTKLKTEKTYAIFLKNFGKMINTSREVYFSITICVLMEQCRSEKDVLSWLNNLEYSSDSFLMQIIHLLFGLFLTPFANTEIYFQSFKLIMRCAECTPNLKSIILSLILYKLTDTIDPTLHFQLLKALPKMAKLKDNLQKVLNTIQTLSRAPQTLQVFSMSLMFDLWKIDNTCYSYLENLLISPCNSTVDKWEFFVNRSHILKELCALKPELYGKDMVAHLSRILNECNDDNGALACAFAIDGIANLCKSEVIDAVTTWATLKPKFENEVRIPVIKSLCGLIYEIPHLPYTEAFPQLIEEVVVYLWHYLSVNRDKEVWQAALNAFTAFSVDQIVAKMPECFLDEDICALRESGTPITNVCWIQFLKHCDSPTLGLVGDFLIKMTSLEIAGYLKYVYYIKGTREPVDYSYLPTNSVVSCIAAYIKGKVLKWKLSVDREVYLECLRIFSQEYSKPLPPLDWCFLQELVHEPAAEEYCITIAAHQVVLSGTARRFIVNYIEAITQNIANISSVLNIYKNLKYIGNSVQPGTIKPFVTVTIYQAIDLFNNGNEEQLRVIIGHLKKMLQDETIQEANKSVIAEIINSIIDTIDSNSKLFGVLLDCAYLFPEKYINEISSPKCMKDTSIEAFKKAVKIRCSLALNTKKSPLNSLNAVAEFGGTFPNIAGYIFEEFSLVFKQHRDNTECADWILDFIRQIQAMIADKCDKNHISFMCDVFVVAVIVFSGHFVLLKDFSSRDEIFKLFPRAIATLFNINHWSICTSDVLNWFLHVITEKVLSQEYCETFGQSMQALRHESDFYSLLRYTKYANIECL